MRSFAFFPNLGASQAELCEFKITIFMPSLGSGLILLNGNEVFEGKQFELGTMKHSEAQIIEFARYMDPLPLHTDPEAAKKSMFGGIIASGAMLYIDAHRRWFVPQFGASIICGLGIRNWNFTQPHYPEMAYTAILTARELKPIIGKGSVQVEWYYTFLGDDGSVVQDLELPVLHRMDGV